MNGCEQELKKAILEDLVRLGKANGLHSFEQVGRWMPSSSFFKNFQKNPFLLLQGEEHLPPRRDVLNSKWAPDADTKGKETGAEGVLQEQD